MCILKAWFRRCYCCDRKSRAACVQSFALRQQATIEIRRHNLSCYCLLAPRIYIFVLRAHSVCGESHNQRNTTGEVATLFMYQVSCKNHTLGPATFNNDTLVDLIDAADLIYIGTRLFSLAVSV